MGAVHVDDTFNLRDWLDEIIEDALRGG